MKNKGFTLIELIVTITLIAVITITVGVSMTEMLNRQKDKDIREFHSLVEKAGCTYVEIKNIEGNTNVTMNNLISAGLISKEETNPENGAKVTDSTNSNIKVQVIWSNNTKTCTYKES